MIPCNISQLVFRMYGGQYFNICIIHQLRIIKRYYRQIFRNVYPSLIQKFQIHSRHFIIIDHHCCTLSGVAVNMSKSFLAKLVFHLSGRIPSDAVIVIFKSMIRQTLDEPLIACNPLHIVIFQDPSDLPVSAFDQRLCQFIGRSGVRHLYTVKRHIFIMIVYKDCRYIPLLNFFKQTQIRIWKCRT